MPKGQDAENASQQKGRAAGIADAERAVGEIRHGRASGRRGDDGRPIEKGVKFLGRDLNGNEHDEA